MLTAVYNKLNQNVTRFLYKCGFTVNVGVSLQQRQIMVSHSVVYLHFVLQMNDTLTLLLLSNAKTQRLLDLGRFR
jgi:hypothetical protein